MHCKSDKPYIIIFVVINIIIIYHHQKVCRNKSHTSHSKIQGLKMASIVEGKAALATCSLYFTYYGSLCLISNVIHLVLANGGIS